MLPFRRRACFFLSVVARCVDKTKRQKQSLVHPPHVFVRPSLGLSIWVTAVCASMLLDRCFGAGGCLKVHVFVSRTHQKRVLVCQWRSFRVVQHVVSPDSLIRPLEVRHCSGVCCVPC